MCGYGGDVTESSFGDLHGDGLDDDTATEQASELTEQLLDEIARAGHSWTAIQSMATALAKLAGVMARGPDPSSGRGDRQA